MVYRLNDKGFFHLHLLSLLLFVLAVYGAYSLYKSHRNDHLRADLLEALEDAKVLTDQFVTDPGQREKVDAAYNAARRIIDGSADISAQVGTIRGIIGNMREMAYSTGKSMGGKGE